MSPANSCRRRRSSFRPKAACRRRAKPIRTPDNAKPRPKYPVAILINDGSASGIGDRRRRAEGFEPRDPRRRNHLRKRLGAKRHPAPGRLRAAPDDGEILHAEQTGHPRARRHADDPRHADRRAGTPAHGAAPRGRLGESEAQGTRELSATRSSIAPSMRSRA